ncbi:TPA: hypothetical protein DEP21_03485 [Patescibacteria group bacterium]|nr:hypothetical protein [Candidatus Gracilibacteria bacterium]
MKYHVILIVSPNVAFFIFIFSCMPKKITPVSDEKKKTKPVVSPSKSKPSSKKEDSDNSKVLKATEL